MGTPTSPEIRDGVVEADNNCDGVLGPDLDGEGYGDERCGGDSWSGRAIYLLRISTEGVEIDDERRLTSPADLAGGATLVWTGESYAPARHDDRTGSLEISFARVSCRP